MGNTLWLIRKTMLTTFRNYKNLLLFIGLPVISILLATLTQGGSGESSLNIGIVNKDGGQALTRDAVQFVSGLDKMHTKEIKEPDANDLIVSGKLDAVLIFPDGFAQSLKGGSPEAVHIESIKGMLVTGYVKSYLNAYIDNIASIGNAAQGNTDKFNTLYANYRNADFGLSAEMVEDHSASRGMTNQTIGYLLVLMLFSAVSLSGIIVKEKENRTYFRLLSAPITARTYVMSNVIVNFVMMMIQIAVTLLVMIRLFHIDPGIPFWQMFLILLMFALVAVSLSLVIVAFSNSSMAASGIQTIVIMPTSLLAGCLFPIEIMPASFQQIANFLPQYWLLDTFSQLQLGSPLTSLSLNLAILLAFAVTLSLVAIYKFGRNKDTRNYI
ncbi:ABC transporter permease [Paenibacillus nasutitermitis]|uniref:Transport permease protein n=1 Tax=Paenibacillus nasutitermitis TaxID=1652958 RepID=A0A916Z476_9BACL|nr:ABC transporter permease [Paenibacillus nasutitermitis]GGD76008.1 ABC transporter permease [Paenibacillus nasutitermitis]